MLCVIHALLKYLIGLPKVRIPVGYQIAAAGAGVIVHAAVSAALHTHIIPEVIVAHDDPQYLQGSDVRKSRCPEASGPGHILNLR